MNWDMYMPNIGYIKIDPENSWSAELGDAANSKRLWINSLVSAHACLDLALKENNSDFAHYAGLILKSYLRNYDVCSGTFQGAWQDEHAVTNRLFVIVAFLHALCGGFEKSVTEIISKHVSIIELLNAANRHAQWLREDAHYVENNHGTMMDFSLAQFGVFLKVIDHVTGTHYINTALQRLEKIFDSTFDKDGCCTENSPTYHFVNYALFTTIAQFIENYRLGNINEWSLKLSKARKVCYLRIRPDGTIPLVGDSEIRPGTFFPMNICDSPEGGIGYYPDAGLFVANMHNLHLTFRAGGTKFTHRHVDDLSFTLWAHGKDFIVDSGMYNYDTSDKLRRWFISSRAHSGIYLESAGHILFRNFESPKRMSEFRAVNYDHKYFEINGVHLRSNNVKLRYEKCLRYWGNARWID